MKKSLAFHVHTEMSNLSLSFKDSINRVEELLDFALESGYSGITITDHETVSAHIRANAWYERKLEEDPDFESKFKLLLGNEIYIAREGLEKSNHRNGEPFYHFVLVALDRKGQEQLRQLSTRAWKRGYFRYVPRRYNTIQDLQEIIGQEPGHVIGSTACLANIAAKMYLDNPEKVDGYLSSMEGIFGKENFFIEISPSLLPEQIHYNKFMVENYKDSFNFIVGIDAHYLVKEDFDIFKIVLQSNRMGNTKDGYDVYKYAYMMSWEEIEEKLSYLDPAFVESCRLNGEKIAAEATYYSLERDIKIPIVDYPSNTPKTRIKEMAREYEQLDKFLDSPHEADRVLVNEILFHMPELIKEEHYPRTLERIDTELYELWEISEKLDVRVSDYLLTVQKVVDIIWEEVQTIVGPGRGSAVAWVTNYLLGITQVNPLEYPLEIPHWRLAR